MDPNSGYYFDPGTKEWNFWSPLYNTYIPCEGGNIEWKKSLQILEKEEEFLRMSRSKSPTTMVKIFEQFKDYTSGDENGDHSYSSFTRHQEDKRKAFEKSLAKDPIRLEPISHVLEKAPQKPAEPWMCIKCDTENGYTRKNCFKCGSKKETAEEFEARGAHLIGIEPNDTLIIRDFPKDIEEAVFRKWIIDFAGSITKRFHVADSKKYYLIQSISIEKATQFLTEFNKVSTQTNITVKVNFSKTPLHELVPEKLATPSAQIPAPVVPAPTFASVGTFASTSTFASTVVSAPSFAPVGTFA
uniref:RanBP2-type domain-containing protein n=1 Tax=Acrobeloides nanus TaxID=290746 RepID=A0A914D627_9BILA